MVAQRHVEASAAAVDGGDFYLARLDVVPAELFAAHPQQVQRPHPVTADEPMKLPGACITGRAGIAHEYAAAAPRQNQRGAQAGRSSADNDGVVHATGRCKRKTIDAPTRAVANC